MHIETLPNFLNKASGSLQNRGKYVSIAPGSDLDTCVVGSNPLVVGAVVPWSENVTSPRGQRSFQAAQAADYGALQLCVWDACEVPFVGPRAPKIVSARVRAADPMPTTAAAAGANPVLVVPFYGRDQLALSIFAPNGHTISFVVRGIKLRGRETFGQDASQSPFVVETATQTYASAVTTDGIYQTSVMYYIGGGGDAREAFDVIEVYAWDGVGASNEYYFLAEAFGERCFR